MSGGEVTGILERMPDCPDCGALPGHPHHQDCDVERCSICRGQRVSCRCRGPDPLASAWTGEYPATRGRVSVGAGTHVGP
jgi:hypothetical protein